MIKKKKEEERNQNIWADNSENNKPMLYWRAQRSLELQANNGLSLAAWARSRAEADGNVNSAAASVWSLKKNKNNHHHFEWGKTLMALSGKVSSSLNSAATWLPTSCCCCCCCSLRNTFTPTLATKHTSNTSTAWRADLTEPGLAWTGVPEHCRAEPLSNGQIITGNDVNTVEALKPLTRLTMAPDYNRYPYIHSHFTLCMWACVCACMRWTLTVCVCVFVGVVAYCCVLLYAFVQFKKK